ADVIWLRLQFNTTGWGSKQRMVVDALGSQTALGYFAALCVLCLLSITLLTAERGFWLKLGAVATSVVAPAYLAAPVGRLLRPLLVHGMLEPARILGTVVLGLLVLRIARGRAGYILLAVLESTNLSNLIGLTSRRGAVDFLYIEALKRFVEV